VVQSRSAPAPALVEISGGLIAMANANSETQVHLVTDEEIERDSQSFVDIDGVKHMVCDDCGRPTYYDSTDDDYHHEQRPEIGCFLIGAEGDTCVVCGASLQAAGGNATAHHYSASILTVIAWTCGDTCADRYEASRQP